MSAAIWWQPDGGTLQELELACLSSWEEIPVNRRKDAETYGGKVYRQHISSGLLVRVEIEAFAGGDQERAIASLESHLARGGSIGLAGDKAKAWCGYLGTSARQGETLLNTGGNVLHQAGTAALQIGDEVAIESMGATLHREVKALSSAAGPADATLALGQGLAWDHLLADTTWVRHRLYLPSAFRPEASNNEPLITSQYRRVYTLSLTLQLDLNAMALLESHDAPPFLLDGISSGLDQGGGVPSIDDFLQSRASSGLLLP